MTGFVTRLGHYLIHNVHDIIYKCPRATPSGSLDVTFIAFERFIIVRLLFSLSWYSSVLLLKLRGVR